jgi:hypothetical protein
MKNNTSLLFNIIPLEYINSKIKKEYPTGIKAAEYGF